MASLPSSGIKTDPSTGARGWPLDDTAVAVRFDRFDARIGTTAGRSHRIARQEPLRNPIADFIQASLDLMGPRASDMWIDGSFGRLGG